MTPCSKCKFATATHCPWIEKGEVFEGLVVEKNRVISCQRYQKGALVDMKPYEIVGLKSNLNSYCRVNRGLAMSAS